MQQPFFILGNPRSGTSLLRIMLDCHSNIVVPPECGFIEWLFEKYGDWDSSQVNDFISDLMETKKFKTWGLKKKSIKNCIARNKPKTYQELCYTVYLSYGEKYGKRPGLWGDKNNYFIKILDKIENIFPEASYIYIVRDGRDVATSYKDINTTKIKSAFKPNLPNSIEEIAVEWDQNNSSIYSFLSSKGNKKYTIIRFEDLLRYPESVLKQITNFLNIEFEENMTQYYIRNNKMQLEPKETLEWKKKTLEKLDTSRINKYKEVLSQNEIELFNSIAEKNLKKFKYI